MVKWLNGTVSDILRGLSSLSCLFCSTWTCKHVYYVTVYCMVLFQASEYFDVHCLWTSVEFVCAGSSPVQSPECTESLQHTKVKMSRVDWQLDKIITKVLLCMKLLLLFLNVFISRKVPGHNFRETVVVPHSSWKLWKLKKSLLKRKKKRELQRWPLSPPYTAVKSFEKWSQLKWVLGLSYDLLVLYVARKETKEKQKSPRSNGGLVGCKWHREKCDSWWVEMKKWHKAVPSKI